jgi:hypothetical protein
MLLDGTQVHLTHRVHLGANPVEVRAPLLARESQEPRDLAGLPP